MIRIGRRSREQNIRRLDVWTLICEMQRLELSAALIEEELRRREINPEEHHSVVAEMVRSRS